MIRFLLLVFLSANILNTICVTDAQTQTTSLPVATVEFPPFTTKMLNRGASGASTEIIQRVLAEIGYNPDITILPTKRAQAQAAQGHFALIYSFTRNKQRSEYCHFTEPLFQIADVFFKRKAQDISWTNIQDVSQKIIGATDGYNYAPVFLEPAKSGELKIDWITADSPELKHLNKLRMKRIDLVICERSVCSYIMSTHRDTFSQLDFIDKAIGPVRDFHACVPKSWTDAENLLNEFNKAYLELKQKGAFQDIHTRWGIVTN